MIVIEKKKTFSAEESEEEVLPQRKRRQQIERSNRHRLGSTSSNVGTSRRRNVQRTNYYEGDESDENTNNPGRTVSQNITLKIAIQFHGKID